MPTGGPLTPGQGPGTPGSTGGPAMVVNQMPPANMQPAQPDFNVIQYDGLKDPVNKSKELFQQLKQSLNVRSLKLADLATRFAKYI